MSRVSFLEDIQDALNNLRAVSEGRPSAPTEVQVAAQKKHLQREQERLHCLAETLRNLASLISSRASDVEIFEYLKIEFDQIKIERIRDETKSQEKSLASERKRLEREKEKLSNEVKRLEEIQRKEKKTKALRNMIAELTRQLSVHRAVAENLTSALKDDRALAGKVGSIVKEIRGTVAAEINGIMDNEDLMKELRKRNFELEKSLKSYEEICKNYERKIEALSLSRVNAQ